MTKEAIRIMQEVRNLSHRDWEELKANLLKLCENEELKETLSVKSEELKETASVEKSLYNIMKEIGIPAHIKGYHYVERAILLVIEDPKMIEGITKVLYPKIAKEFNSTASRVERAIRHAIEKAWDRGDIEKLQEIFGYTYSLDRGKPTNSEFIAGIADHILHS